MTGTRSDSTCAAPLSTSVAFPNLDRRQKAVDPKTLDSYVGLYEGSVRITGEGDSILFVSERGPEGRVQLRAHNIGGSEEVAKRLN